jgi:hypothetical protein
MWRELENRASLFSEALAPTLGQAKEISDTSFEQELDQIDIENEV